MTERRPQALRDTGMDAVEAAELERAKAHRELAVVQPLNRARTAETLKGDESEAQRVRANFAVRTGKPASKGSAK